VLLDGGRKIDDGDVGHILDRYSRMMSDSREHQIDLATETDKPVDLVSIGLAKATGESASAFDITDGLTISIDYVVKERLHGFQMTLTLARNMIDVFHAFDTDDLEEILPTDPGHYQFRYTIPPRFLKAGIYTVRLGCGTAEELFHDVQGAASFEIEDLSENTHHRGYRRDRPGQVISPGRGSTTQVPE
jgi:lipopolysaccharide transport system ATP-binding protein